MRDQIPVPPSNDPGCCDRGVWAEAAIGTRRAAPIVLVFGVRVGLRGGTEPHALNLPDQGFHPVCEVSLAVRRLFRPSLFMSRASSALRRGGAVEGAPVPLSHPQVLRFVAGLRRRYLLAIDLVGIVVAAYVALALRFDRFSGPILLPAFPVVVCILLAVRTITNLSLIHI